MLAPPLFPGISGARASGNDARALEMPLMGFAHGFDHQEGAVAVGAVVQNPARDTQRGG